MPSWIRVKAIYWVLSLWIMTAPTTPCFLKNSGRKILRKVYPDANTLRLLECWVRHRAWQLCTRAECCLRRTCSIHVFFFFSKKNVFSVLVLAFLGSICSLHSPGPSRSRRQWKVYPVTNTPCSIQVFFEKKLFLHVGSSLSRSICSLHSPGPSRSRRQTRHSSSSHRFDYTKHLSLTFNLRYG
jgi:hypothetical protein